MVILVEGIRSLKMILWNGNISGPARTHFLLSFVQFSRKRCYRHTQKHRLVQPRQQLKHCCPFWLWGNMHCNYHIPCKSSLLKTIWVQKNMFQCGGERERAFDFSINLYKFLKIKKQDVGSSVGVSICVGLGWCMHASVCMCVQGIRCFHKLSIISRN